MSCCDNPIVFWRASEQTVRCLHCDTEYLPVLDEIRAFVCAWEAGESFDTLDPLVDKMKEKLCL